MRRLTITRFQLVAGIQAVVTVLLVLILAVSGLQAAGTVTVTNTPAAAGNPRLITLAWTATAGGAVSGNSFTIQRGTLVQAKFVPAGSGDQPTDLYDLTLVDSDGVDLMAGVGSNLSNASATLLVEQSTILEAGSYDLVVANAGSAKKGTVYLWVR